ncbi:MAG: type II toxin-antitoxin system HicB family antitoxin [Candidatus Poribacteria bacterium]
MLNKLIFRAEIFQEDDVYVGLCPELNVSSYGEDIDEAKQSLQEAVEGFLETCEAMGTLEEVLEEAGFFHVQDAWISREPIIEERLSISR